MSARMERLAWIDDHSELLRLARWLVEQERIAEVSDLLYFFEKPWKWEDEREEMLAADALGDE